MFQKGYRLYGLFTLLFSTAFLWFFYGEILLAPNDYLFQQYGDGLNQYYSFSYFIQHNQGFIDNEGLNYPYGEHYVYSDGQPLFAYCSKLLSTPFPILKEYSVGLFNSLLLLSLWLSPFLLFALMARLKIRPVLVFAGVVGISFLQPQILRLAGHFSLSYSVVIPWILYLSLLVKTGRRPLLWTTILFLSQLVFLLTHPYLGLMTCLLSGSLWFFNYLYFFKGTWRNWKSYVYPLLIFVLPIVLFKVFMNLTDAHPNKSDDVYGLLVFCGKPVDVFLPHAAPLAPIIEKVTPVRHTFEGQAYVGVTTLLSLLIGGMFGVFYRLRKKKNPDGLPFEPLLTIAFLAALPLLLLSWAFPFIQFPELIDQFSVIRQFRALGRFAWPFFYVSTVFSIYLIHRAAFSLEKGKYKVIAWLLMILGPLLYVVEGYQDQAWVAKKATVGRNIFDIETTFDMIKPLKKEIDPNAYQAILPLPHYYYGSGSFCRPRIGGTMQISMALSVHLGLPIIGAVTARGDVWESRNIVQIGSPSYYPKMMKKDLKSDKPFLITRSSKDEPLSIYEQKILNRATLLAEGKGGFAIFEISKEDLFLHNSAALIEAVEDNIQDSSLINLGNNLWATDSSLYFYKEDFEKTTGDEESKIFGGDKHQRYVLSTCRPPVPINSTDREYMASLWIYNGAINAANYIFFNVELVDQQGNVRVLSTFRADETPIIDGDWSMLELPFSLPMDYHPEQHKIQIANVACSINASKAEFKVRELWIRQRKGDLYYVQAGEETAITTLVYNGHILKR